MGYGGSQGVRVGGRVRGPPLLGGALLARLAASSARPPAPPDHPSLLRAHPCPTAPRSGPTWSDRSPGSGGGCGAPCRARTGAPWARGGGGGGAGAGEEGRGQAQRGGDPRGRRAPAAWRRGFQGAADAASAARGPPQAARTGRARRPRAHPPAPSVRPRPQHLYCGTDGPSIMPPRPPPPAALVGGMTAPMPPPALGTPPPAPPMGPPARGPPPIPPSMPSSAASTAPPPPPPWPAIAPATRFMRPAGSAPAAPAPGGGAAPAPDRRAFASAAEITASGAPPPAGTCCGLRGGGGLPGGPASPKRGAGGRSSGRAGFFRPLPALPAARFHAAHRKGPGRPLGRGWQAAAARRRRRWRPGPDHGREARGKGWRTTAPFLSAEAPRPAAREVVPRRAAPGAGAPGAWAARAGVACGGWPRRWGALPHRQLQERADATPTRLHYRGWSCAGRRRLYKAGMGGAGREVEG
jgi:hypothetical protein